MGSIRPHQRSVFFFAWTAVHGKILTFGNSICGKPSHVNWCFVCKHDEETIYHLLLLCDVARDLWSVKVILFLFGLECLFSRSVKDALCLWRGAKASKRRKKAWYLAPLGVM